MIYSKPIIMCKLFNSSAPFERRQEEEKMIIYSKTNDAEFIHPERLTSLASK